MELSKPKYPFYVLLILGLLATIIVLAILAFVVLISPLVVLLLGITGFFKMFVDLQKNWLSYKNKQKINTYQYNLKSKQISI